MTVLFDKILGRLRDGNGGGGGGGGGSASAATTSQIDGKSTPSAFIAPSNLDYAARSVLPKVQDLVGTDLYDCSYVPSSGTPPRTNIYQSFPSSNPTYTLPNGLSELAPYEDHEIVLIVGFQNGATSVTFKERGETPATVTPVWNISGISSTSVVMFICIYTLDFGWKIYPIPMSA